MITKTKEISVILLLFIFIVEKYFFLFQSIDWKILYIVLAFLILFKYRSRTQLFLYSKAVNLYVLIIIICFFNTAINGYLPFANAIKNYLLIFFICLYYPLTVLIQRITLEKAENTVILMGLIASAISILQVELGYNIINAKFIGFRDGNLRLTLSVLLQQFAAVLLFYRSSLVKGFKRFKILVLFLILSYSIFAIAQTRSASFCYLITMLYYLYKLYLKNSFKKIIGKKNVIILSLVLVVIGIYVGFNYVNTEISNSFETNESSSVKRMHAYTYYWNLFEKYPIAGTGLNEGALNVLSTSGIWDKLYKDDIGIVGFLAEFGLLGLISLLFFIKTLFTNLRQCPYSPHIIFSLQLFFILPFNCPLNIDTGVFYFALILAMNTVYFNTRK